jgi:6-phosphofructokinase 1
VFIPEHPPQVDDWRAALRRTVEAGRAIGRRQNLVIVAEGARDLQGEPITSEQVRETLADGLGEDTRITILGHVQRGGAPSAFDRNLGTQCGYHAVHELLRSEPDAEPVLVGIRENRIESSPLMDAVERTHAVAEHLDRGEFDAAMELRGGSFAEAYQTMRTLVRAQPRAAEGERSLRFLVLHAGAPAPGMNTAVRAAVRIAMDVGHTVLGARGGFPGVVADDIEVLDWMSVSGWVADGGAELGTSRSMPEGDDIARVAERLVEHEVDGVLLVGGFDGYEAAYRLHLARERYPVLKLPIVCLPATISNDVPGTELTIGADTALNSIVLDVDKIKQSAVADKRCFIVEVMGKDSGYLALNAGMATGAERIYTPETGIDLDRLQSDVAELRAEFQAGQRLGLIIKGEHADPVYTTPFLWALFSKEGNGDFDVRQSILGHLQQGGDPSPFDRIQATRLAARCIEFLQQQAGESAPESAMSGLVSGKVTFTPLTRFWDLLDGTARRAAHRPWKSLRPIADAMSMPPEA